jgi:hypothetical protein
LLIGLVLSVGTFASVIQFGSILSRQVFSVFLPAHRARGILSRDLHDSFGSVWNNFLSNFFCVTSNIQV